MPCFVEFRGGPRDSREACIDKLSLELCCLVLGFIVLLQWVRMELLYLLSD